MTRVVMYSVKPFVFGGEQLMGTADATGHHRPWVTQPSISSGILARSLLVENLRAHACARQAVSGENLLGISTTLPLFASGFVAIGFIRLAFGNQK